MFKHILHTSILKLYVFCFLAAAPLKGTALLSSQGLQTVDNCSPLKMRKKSNCPIDDRLNVVFSNYQKYSYIMEVNV